MLQTYIIYIKYPSISIYLFLYIHISQYGNMGIYKYPEIQISVIIILLGDELLGIVDIWVYGYADILKCGYTDILEYGYINI